MNVTRRVGRMVALGLVLSAALALLGARAVGQAGNHDVHVPESSEAGAPEEAAKPDQEPTHGASPRAGSKGAGVGLAQAEWVKLYPVRDTWINRNDPGVGYPNADYLRVGVNACPGQTYTTAARSLLYFDLSAIPSNAHIGYATLHLNQIRYYNAASVANTYINFDYATGPWDASVTWNTQPGRQYAGLRVPISLVDRWWAFELGYAVQQWVNGTHPNYGFVIDVVDPYGNTPLCDQRVFRSAESDTKPELEIYYVLMTPTPTPTRSRTPTYTPTRTPPGLPTFTRTRTPTPTKTPTLVRLAYLHIVRDTWVDYFTPNQGYARADYLRVGPGQCQGVATQAIGRALMLFDLSSIPPNAHIERAQLQLLQRDHLQAAAAPDTRIQIRRIQSAWGDDVTWNSMPQFTQWSYGAITATAQNGQNYWDVTDLVSMWYDHTYANNGLMLLTEPDVAYPPICSQRVYCSSEAWLNSWPVINVYYSGGFLTPTPTLTPTRTGTPTVTRTRTPAGVPPPTWWLPGTPTSSPTRTQAAPRTPSATARGRAYLPMLLKGGPEGTSP